MAHATGRLTLWGIEVFLATAEEGAISAAARRLGTSPSVVSQQLTSLESDLDVELLDRSKRPIALTAAGELFRKRAQTIFAEAQSARAEVSSRDLARLSHFHLGMIEDFDSDVTPRLLADMADDLKDCHFLLETGASHYLFDQLDGRALDMIACAEIGPVPDWAEVTPLLEEPFIAAAPKGHVSDPKALLDLPLIQYTHRHHMGRQIGTHLQEQGVNLSHRFELDSYHAIMAMVAAGSGWTILTPLGYRRAWRFRDMAEIFPLPFAPVSRRISLISRKGKLEDMPERVADRLRRLLQEAVVEPAIKQTPWLEDKLKVL
jgi:DNA-binding transcriptional LysR family regulator